MATSPPTSSPTPSTVPRLAPVMGGAAIFLGVSCAVSVPSSALVGSCVYSPAGVGGAEGRVGSWGCGHLGVVGARGGRELRARGLPFPGTRAMRTGPAPTRACAGVAGTQEC